ncbi:haloacid dehalogenase-like hydrolase domain-containing protein At4g39970 isoform X2 [Arachis ipaensis]|uniref:haloacid dehalogenase-like hydrolase domain-containing protein At4g39970 isoform X2 n=1 Tax=Arachis ipaensis TaxID=130454 RepID=UPI000A2B5BA9|nr:haloacid dehalogenase-like hydrolase domain-containing protein At4g39970 isoform X2 [Arachis ipaensis]
MALGFKESSCSLPNTTASSPSQLLLPLLLSRLSYLTAMASYSNLSTCTARHTTMPSLTSTFAALLLLLLLHFYDELQNQIGGGKPKMRWYFKEHGWPSSTLFETPPTDDDDRANLIDTLQDWKTERYKEIIKSGTVKPRPGVLRLMDEVKEAGIKLAVCSAATKSSVIMCLESLIGIERFQGLDCFLAGDDVKEKKPDPSIYITASKKLGVSEKDCLVVEDSVIGLQAATQAGMSCIVTYTSSTASQDFSDAIAIYPDLSNVRLKDLELLLQNLVAAK